VAVEDRAEPGRDGQRRGDDGGVGLVLHIPMFPATGAGFAVALEACPAVAGMTCKF
jgi:hypothetical protein